MLKLKQSTHATAKRLKTTPNMVLKSAALGVAPAQLKNAVNSGYKLQHIVQYPDTLKSILKDKQKSENLRNVLQTLSANRKGPFLPVITSRLPCTDASLCF